MIDTDKYKGHTEGPWELSPDDWVWAEHLFMQDNTTNFGNAMLITDAPLLLAEVKRLRGELERIENNMAWTVHVWQNENYTGRQEWMEQMCEMYTDLAFVKAIEAEYYGDEEE